MADEVYTSSLDVSDFIAGLRKMQAENEKTAKKVEDDFGKRMKGGSDKFAESLKNTNEQSKGLGSTFGKLQSAASAFIAVFATGQVINFFKNIAAAAVGASSQFEVYQTQFETLLGSTGEAKSRLEELARFGVETPFELPEIVEASRQLEIFGGKTLATGDNLRMIGDIAAGVNQPFQDVAFWVGRMYDALQNGQPFGEAALRLQEMGALSGDTRREMEALQKAGADGNKIFEVFSDQVGGRFAGNMERLSQTLQGIVSNLNDFRDNLLRVGGEAYFDQVKADAGEFLDIISSEETASAIESLASALGEMAAQAQAFVTTPILESLQDIEPQTIQDLADALQSAADALSEFLQQDFDADLNSLIKLLTVLADTVTVVTNTMNGFRNIIEPISPILTAFRHVLQSIFAPLTLIIEGFKALNDLVSTFTGKDLASNTRDAAEATKTQAQEQKNLTEAYKEYADARKADTGPASDIGAKDEAIQVEEELATATEETAKAAEEAAMAEENLATATDKASTARSGAAKSEGELEKARTAAAKTKDEIAKAEEDLQADILAAQKKAQDELIQVEIDTAQKREDIARANAQKLEDIFRKNRQAIADAATDLRRDEEDIARKNAQALEDLEREQAKKEIEIEEETKNQLKKIQEDFNRDATQAERNRDAIAFLAAVERKDQAVTDALEKRDSEIESLKTEGEEKRAELEQQRQRELEDARLANQRKLQDLQQSLQRELEEQRIARERDLEEVIIGEERKREAIAASLAAQLEQLKAAHAERLAELKQQLQEELAAIQEATARARSGAGSGGSISRGSSTGRRSGIAGNEQFNRAKKKTRDFATASGFFGKRKKRFADGGPVLGLSPILVGDANEEEKNFIEQSRRDNPELFVGNSGAVTPVGLGGPEIFNPPESGRVIPNDAVGDFFRNYMPADAMARNLGASGGISNVDNSRTINQNVGMLDPQSVSGIAIAAAQRTALEVVKDIVK